MTNLSLLEKTNLLGAYLAVAIFSLCSLIFITRLFQQPDLGLGIGVVLLLAALPLILLLWTAPQVQRPALYYLQVGLMLAFLVVELLLDYVFKLDFRGVRPAVIAYVMLFFAGTGGMIGVAANAGGAWSLTAGILFLIMAVLTFVQRAVTGY
jgi:hypothetical protein